MRYPLLYLFLLILTISSCQNVLSEKYQYLRDYNRNAALLTNDIMIKTSAKEISDKEIKLEFLFRVREDSFKQELMVRSAPDLVSAILYDNPKSKYLIDNGIRFKVEIYNENSVHLDSFNIDKSTLETKPILSAQGGIQSALQSINSLLPIENKETGIKFTNIQLSDNDLIYHYQLPDDLIQSFSDPVIDKDLEVALIEDEEAKQLLRAASPYRIDRVKCIYRDKEQKTIKEIVVDRKSIIGRKG